MKSNTCLRAAAGAGLLVLAGSAFAADMGPPPPPDTTVAHGNCLYFRVDGGAAFFERPRVKKNVPPGFDGFPVGVSEAIDEDFSNTPFIEGGVGCQFTPSLRAEVTGGYIFRSSLEDDFDSLDAKWQAFTGFVNVFWDITNYAGFTPYLGAGIGVAFHEITDVDAPPDSSSGSNTQFAWNATAGVSYDITSRLKADLAYRFVDLGNAKSGGPVPMHVEDIQAHEVKFGLRYHFGYW